MRATLVDIISRISRRPLALGTVLVAVRETQEVRPLRFEQVRPASAWAHLLGFFALAFSGFSAPAESAERMVSLRHPAAVVASGERCSECTAGEQPSADREMRPRGA
jgi:hypothetical protein